MSMVRVLCGNNSYCDIDAVPIECPFCHSFVTPQYIFQHSDFMFAECPNTRCRRHFVLGYYNGFDHVLPNSEPAKKSFSEMICVLSPAFETIYNQAFIAEQMGLNQICGVGYRKALEFLIKDYLLSSISKDDTEMKNQIKVKSLGKCISEDVSNEKIKIVARRAVWLGNDETHYVRLWSEKDVSHLKGLIDLTVHWIESEIETQRLLNDMPGPK